MSTYTDLEHFSSGGWLTSASTVPQIRKTSANASFLNLGGLAGAAFGAATSAAGPFGGAVGGLTGGLAGKAGSGPILMPEPKAPSLHSASKFAVAWQSLEWLCFQGRRSAGPLQIDVGFQAHGLPRRPLSSTRCWQPWPACLRGAALVET